MRSPRRAAATKSTTTLGPMFNSEAAAECRGLSHFWPGLRAQPRRRPLCVLAKVPGSQDPEHSRQEDGQPDEQEAPVHVAVVLIADSPDERRRDRIAQGVDDQ